MIYIIQYSAFNKLKGNRLQHYLKEVNNLEYYQQKQKDGIIWNLEIIEL